MPSRLIAQACCEHRRAAADDVVGVEQRAGPRLVGEQRRQLLLALDERQLAEVDAVEREQVEGVVADAPALALGDRLLKRAEIGLAVLVGDHHLAVDQRRDSGRSASGRTSGRNLSVQSRPVRV